MRTVRSLGEVASRVRVVELDGALRRLLRASTSRWRLIADMNDAGLVGDAEVQRPMSRPSSRQACSLGDVLVDGIAGASTGRQGRPADSTVRPSSPSSAASPRSSTTPTPSAPSAARSSPTSTPSPSRSSTTCSASPGRAHRPHGILIAKMRNGLSPSADCQPSADRQHASSRRGLTRSDGIRQMSVKAWTLDRRGAAGFGQACSHRRTSLIPGKRMSGNGHDGVWGPTRTEAS